MTYSGDGLCSKHKFYYIFKPSKCSKIGVFGVVKFFVFSLDQGFGEKKQISDSKL